MRSSHPAFGHDSPAAGFDQPFEMLGACHQRVRRSLALLQRLVAHVQAQGVDAQARDAAADVLRYFRMAAPAHHEDEERHVIPRLRATGHPRWQALAQRLLDDHQAIGQCWSTLDPLLAAVADGRMPDRAALQGRADAFVELHREHLALEDEGAFPTAQAQLDAQALHAMGREMAARRGGTAPPAGSPLAGGPKASQETSS